MSHNETEEKGDSILNVASYCRCRGDDADRGETVRKAKFSIEQPHFCLIYEAAKSPPPRTGRRSRRSALGNFANSHLLPSSTTCVCPGTPACIDHARRAPWTSSERILRSSRCCSNAPTSQPAVFCCPSRVVLQFHTEGGGHEELVSNGLMLPPPITIQMTPGIASSTFVKINVNE